MRELKNTNGEFLFNTDNDGLLRHGIQHINTGNTRDFSYSKMINMHKAGALITNEKGELTYTYSEDSDLNGKTVICVDSDGEPFLESHFKWMHNDQDKLVNMGEGED